MKISSVLFSFKTTLTLLAILAIGAGYATFIENDFGTSSARVLVYNNIWYETILVLTTVNLTGIIFKYKMWKNTPRFIFHTSFVVILIGAGVTRYTGYEGIMQIKEGTTENRMISLEPYLQVTIKDGEETYFKEYQMEFAALSEESDFAISVEEFYNKFDHTIAFGEKEVNILYKNFFLAKKGTAKMGMLTIDVTIDGETQELKLPGRRSQKGLQRELKFGDVSVFLEYGSKVLTLPFAIKLNDFQLDRYPGSMSPSSYASEVTVIKKDATTYDYRIFMNKTMHEGNFLFFQSSYFPDETGTVLSVNNDPGKWPTYLGYFLLTLGLCLNFFDKKSRFRKLTKFVDSKSIASIAAACIFVFSATSLNADETDADFKVKAQQTVEYLKTFKNESAQTAKNFARLVTQSSSGRMKPISSLNREIVLKLSGKTEFLGMNADQIVLGILTRPEVWRDIKLIKIKTPKLKNFIGVDASRKHIAFAEVFKDGKYLLSKESEKASLSKPNERGTYERDIIKIDERLNIIYAVFNGSLFNIFPKVETAEEAKDAKIKHRWYTPMDAMNDFEGRNKTAVEAMTRGLINAVIQNNWKDANSFIKMIATYQEKVGSNVVLSQAEIDNEIMFNEIDIFPKVMLAYIFLGIIILIAAFFVVFNPSIKPKKTTFVFFVLLSLIFAVHTYGMGFRWIISGHAPWSDTYETLLYISWSAIFAGIMFFRKSLLALSAAVIVAGIFMFTAHLTGIDPQITNLVPVLKSYWLTIHVSILTASYGFFALAAILGYMTLIMFIFRKNRPHIDETIKHVTAIIEIALIVGLAAITIGNFLGGIWANESWGRYWGWDPKETWAYVSIVVYAIVVHLRFVKPLSTPFVFAAAALIAFSTILMTYFGVNFYLAGMHSYATGDPIPIPTWVYYVVAIVVVTIALAYKNRHLKPLVKN
ncbi:cytochrome c biogenesis protein CcsA [Poseidonibacter lekithochrous]|uniref:cytochrome c biogenesis protein CcsA n=1 Tax=Poseidonibacter TaxID=2321187 RepID=UPI001C08FE67|nr:MULTISPECIES: cytochrome c biogenesis protein CcsA [Poseidonibacter]MBU3014919.1 cytochrome c biogenesis protein CcsA [Poseidonibacter lekithochrous]MDO6828217.1 cytochrome c biogenesis protein CcsA [Poseidonibacter sp. 1_MG-2023]